VKQLQNPKKTSDLRRLLIIMEQYWHFRKEKGLSHYSMKSKLRNTHLLLSPDNIPE
jgi:hypothetical protein